jgi:hypothetical protein
MSNVYPRTLAEEMAQWVREDQGGRFDQHPEPETLAAYHSGSLSPEKDLEIQQHLLLCPECPDLLLDLEDLFEPRHRDLDLSDSWVSAAWRDLQRKLVTSGPSAKESLWRRWMRLFSAVPRPVHAMASGMMFVLLVGCTFQISWLRQELARPVGQIPEVVLFTTRSLSQEPIPVKFPAKVARVRLSVRLMEDTQPVQAEFLDNGELLWKIPVRADEEGLAHIEISRRSLDPGEYDLKLKGSKNASTFPIRIIHL